MRNPLDSFPMNVHGLRNYSAMVGLMRFGTSPVKVTNSTLGGQTAVKQGPKTADGELIISY
jgi:hypothetical protein